MSLPIIHQGLANASTWFIAILAIWAFVQFLRGQALDGNWFGTAVIGELLLVAQFLVGWLLYFQGYGDVLVRPFMHILYGVVAVITLPAGYAYFNNIGQPKVQTLAMAAICAFLWGIILRASQVVYMQVPY
jgi:hypothetical protein